MTDVIDLNVVWKKPYDENVIQYLITIPTSQSLNVKQLQKQLGIGEEE